MAGAFFCPSEKVRSWKIIHSRAYRMMITLLRNSRRDFLTSKWGVRVWPRREESITQLVYPFPITDRFGKRTNRGRQNEASADYTGEVQGDQNEVAADQGGIFGDGRTRFPPIKTGF